MADQQNAEDGAGSEATDSADESDTGDSDNDDEEEMREGGDDEKAEADIAESDEEDISDEDQEYRVEKLLRKRRIRRGRGWSTQYLIRWLGYGPEHDTWQPEWTVADTKALDEFEERLYGTESAITAT